MRRFTIMGFTEAELGFVLAALFVAVAVTAVHERDGNAQMAIEQVGVMDSLRVELRGVRDSLDAVRDSLTALRRRSELTPLCSEKGERVDLVASVAVLGANLYSMNGDTVTIGDIRDRLSAYLERGKSLDCWFRVRAWPTAGVDAVQHSEAVSLLRQSPFYVNDRPR